MAFSAKEFRQIMDELDAMLESGELTHETLVIETVRRMRAAGAPL